MSRARTALAIAAVPLALAGCGSAEMLIALGAGGGTTGPATGAGGGATTSSGAGGGATTSPGAGGGATTSPGAGGGATTDSTTSSTGSGGSAPPTGHFDADRMYVVGTLDEGAVGFDVFCDVLDPNHPTGGFPGFWGPYGPNDPQRDAYVRPSDGRLVYLANGVVRAFEPDPLGSPPSPIDYPKYPLANDAVLPTPGCAGVTAFHVRRADGTLVYTCGDGWFDALGAPFPTCPEPDGPLRIDGDGAQLCEGSVIDPGGVGHPRPESPKVWSGRARPQGGFWGITVNDAGRFERWSIEHDGTTTRDGVFAAMPAGLWKVNGDWPGWTALDALGNLYRWATDEAAPTADLIVRFSADFQGAAVVYDEAKKPRCKLHAFNFVASP